MVPQADITLILSQPPAAGRPDSGSRSEAGDTRFQDAMENAVRGASPARENSASRRETANAAASTDQNTVRKEEAPAKPEDRSPSLDNPVTGPTPGGPADSPSSADSGAAAVESSIRQLDQLGVLNINGEQVDALLGLLEGGVGTDLQALLQSLARQLNLTATQQNRVTEFFKQAGLTEQQARNLLANLQNAPTGSTPLGLARNLSGPAAVSAEAASSVEAKGDGVSRLAQPPQAGTSPERLSPMETILSRAENQAGSSSSENQERNNGPQGLKLNDLLPDSRNLIQPPLTENQSPLASPLKGTEGLKTPLEVHVESLTAVSNPAVKSVEGGAPVQPETVISRGPSESRVMEQILNKVNFRSNGSQNEIRIRLEPPSLGTVRMNITTTGDSVRTVIVADSHTVKQIIENNFTQLRDSLNGQGLKVDGFTVLVGGDSAQNGGSYSQPGEQTGFGGFRDYQDPLLSETRTDEARPPMGIRMIYGDSQTISVFA